MATQEQAVAAFTSNRIRGDASGQVHRAGRRFGLIAAAGELAVTLGIVPWEEGAPTHAAYACFESWLEHRGGNDANQEESQAIERVRRFLEQHGESRFTSWDDAQAEEQGRVSARSTINRAGFKRRTEDLRQGRQKWWTRMCCTVACNSRKRHAMPIRRTHVLPATMLLWCAIGDQAGGEIAIRRPNGGELFIDSVSGSDTN
jgi:uncharacterized protein (DUF927 family)